MIPVFRPSYDEQELEALREIFSSGWIGMGPKTKEFEDQFASYIGSEHAVGVNSCTAALHLALLTVGVEGREVITTSMSFVSTNMAILYNQGIPVFADIEPDTLNIDVESIKQKVGAKTRVVLVVHYGGHACDMDPIMKLAEQYGLIVIEDCAHGCGGFYNQRKLGSIGHMGCFSFHAVKNLATGDGGMITTNDEDLALRLRKLRWLGISKDTWRRTEIDRNYSWFYTVEEKGFKYQMNDITAAIGIVQLRKLDSMNQKRKKIVHAYNTAFEGLSWLECPFEKEYAESACHNYVVKVEDRDRFIDHLSKSQISASVHYFPNHLYELFQPYRCDLPVTEEVWKRIATLPLYPDMSSSDIDRVINVVRSFQPGER